MNAPAPIPWPGLILALLSAAAMLVAGVNPWLVLAIVLLWCGSLWLVRPEPQESGPRIDRASVSQDVMRELIEPIGIPLVLFDRDRIIAANLFARDALGGHIIGQDGRIALRHPEAVRLLELADGDSVTIKGLTGARSLWQLTRRRVDRRYWIIEMIDRTLEADVSRAHTDFVANASHELRTPLATIIGYVETLSDGGDEVDKETSARFHATVLREARRMQTLVSDLLSLSQLEAEKHDSPTDLIDMRQLVARVAGEFAGRPDDHRVTFTVPETAPPVIGDERQLEQLVRNLIDNALKYGDAAKPVSATLNMEASGELSLTIADRGAGIDALHLPHLTRRFYRTDPGRSRAAGGTGLGLAIVKHIVERHRGKLDIASVINHGTTVTVRLPAAEKQGTKLQTGDRLEALS